MLDRLIARAKRDLRRSATALAKYHPPAPADASFAVVDWPGKVATWARRAWAYLAALRRAAATLLIGPGPLDPADEAKLAEADARQRSFFDRFVAAVDSGEQSPTGVAARAEKYASASWQVAENTARARTLRDGHIAEERRVLGHAERHCETCVEQADLGWQPAGVLLPLGDSECQSACRCFYMTR